MFYLNETIRACPNIPKSAVDHHVVAYVVLARPCDFLQESIICFDEVVSNVV